MNQLSLHVRVIEATDLPKMDVLGKIDPYCILYSSSSSKKQKTKTIKKNYNPKWNQDFTFPVANLQVDKLHIELFDYDEIGSDDAVSKMDLPISQFPIGQVVDQWYNMAPVKGVKKGGRLHLNVQVAPANVAPFSPCQPMGYGMGMNMGMNQFGRGMMPNQQPFSMPNQQPMGAMAQGMAGMYNGMAGMAGAINPMGMPPQQYPGAVPIGQPMGAPGMIPPGQNPMRNANPTMAQIPGMMPMGQPMSQPGQYPGQPRMGQPALSQYNMGMAPMQPMGQPMGQPVMTQYNMPNIPVQSRSAEIPPNQPYIPQQEETNLPTDQNEPQYYF